MSKPEKLIIRQWNAPSGDELESYLQKKAGPPMTLPHRLAQSKNFNPSR
jgi:hypothetical protein